jgi:4-hydroxy-3-polyprenylbenzoate decarboxylase
MDKAIELWQKAGLPQLKLQEPWYGYNLGFWSEENEQQAELAVRGEYYQTGEVLSRRRQKAE